MNNIKAFQTMDKCKLWKSEFAMQVLCAGSQGHPKSTWKLNGG